MGGCDPWAKNADNAQTEQGQPVVIPILANDFSPSGTVLTVRSATTPMQQGGGTATINSETERLPTLALVTFVGTRHRVGNC
jgi:hypothetical protein